MRRASPTVIDLPKMNCSGTVPPNPRVSHRCVSTAATANGRCPCFSFGTRDGGRASARGVRSHSCGGTAVWTGRGGCDVACTASVNSVRCGLTIRASYSCGTAARVITRRTAHGITVWAGSIDTGQPICASDRPRSAPARAREDLMVISNRGGRVVESTIVSMVRDRDALGFSDTEMNLSVFGEVFITILFNAWD
jgi:hypothetical protein